MENIHITYKSSVVRTGDSVFWVETRLGSVLPKLFAERVKFSFETRFIDSWPVHSSHG